MNIATQKPKIVLKNGKPQSVVLSIDMYERLLELVEDKQDLLEVRRIKKQGVSFKELSNVL